MAAQLSPSAQHPPLTPSPRPGEASSGKSKPQGGPDRTAGIGNTIIAILALVCIAVSLGLRWRQAPQNWIDLPLMIALAVGGGPLVAGLLVRMIKREFGSDLLAGIAMVSAAIQGEYLAGALVVLMLSGGQALEAFAVRRASSVLAALAKRMPSVGHRKHASGVIEVPLSQIEIGDELLVFPHEICPVDGVVTDGHGMMDESYLTGEPFMITKAPGSEVLSGSLNGQALITICAQRRAEDSRYAKIVKVMEASEQDRPQLRRLGDRLGAWYTPLALIIAGIAWAISGHPREFLAVLVVATPCPLLIAIPVAIIGSISLCAKRGIIIKRPIVLELASTCRTGIFDKTGTLTYGEPTLTAVIVPPDIDRREALGWAASLERYSKHPLAEAVLKSADAQGIQLRDATQISEKPGEGLCGVVDGKQLQLTSRRKLPANFYYPEGAKVNDAAGLECVLLMNGRCAAVMQFRDEPRRDGMAFVQHLGNKHGIKRLMLVSGDRKQEVEYLAAQVGITEVHAGQSPEQKVEIVRHETEQAPTLYVGDGINDAPALTTATVGIALGQRSDITGEAAGAVILETSLKRVDEFLHISRRMRRIALQSAVGGMALSIIGMGFAAAGLLPPVAGAVAQEIIDVLAVLNALRVARMPRTLTDF